MGQDELYSSLWLINVRLIEIPVKVSVKAKGLVINAKFFTE
jgi:hypothetical protein